MTSGATNEKFREALLKEGIETSSSVTSLFLSRYQKTGRLTDAPRGDRKHKLANRNI